MLRTTCAPAGDLTSYVQAPLDAPWALGIRDASDDDGGGMAAPEYRGWVAAWGLRLRTRPCAPPYRWRAIAPATPDTPPGRVDAAAAVYGGAWYMWGGRGAAAGWDADALWRFDFATATWSSLGNAGVAGVGAAGAAAQVRASVAALQGFAGGGTPLIPFGSGLLAWGRPGTPAGNNDTAPAAALRLFQPLTRPPWRTLPIDAAALAPPPRVWPAAAAVSLADPAATAALTPSGTALLVYGGAAAASGTLNDDTWIIALPSPPA